MERNQFGQALNRLMNDDVYRESIKENPRQLLEDYQLTKEDLQLISQVHTAATKEDPDVQGYAWEDDWGDVIDWINDNFCCN